MSYRPLNGQRAPRRVLRGFTLVELLVVIGKKKIYPTPNSPEMPITVEALPERYNKATELKLDVLAGQNHKVFILFSK